MRRCLIVDLVEAARLVAASPEAQRDSLSSRLIAEADAAHRYMKRFGRPHPVWGNGSLTSRALADPPARISTQSTAFLQALSLLCARLAQRKTI